MIGQLIRQAQSPSAAWLLGASGLAFGLMVASFDPAVGLPPLCGGGFGLDAVRAAARLEWLTFDPQLWLLQWLTMFCAMMLPLLIQPIDHVVRTSPSSRLPRSIGLFVLGYGVAWLPPAALASLAGAALEFALPVGALATGLVLGALVWSASPPAQSARNRSHDLAPLETRGLRADRDCLLFGLRTGIWCAVACWPWMLLSQAMPDRGPGLMLVVAAVLLAERAMPPGPPRWQAPRIWRFVAALRPRSTLSRL